MFTNPLFGWANCRAGRKNFKMLTYLKISGIINGIGAPKEGSCLPIEWHYEKVLLTGRSVVLRFYQAHPKEDLYRYYISGANTQEPQRSSYHRHRQTQRQQVGRARCPRQRQTEFGDQVYYSRNKNIDAGSNESRSSSKSLPEFLWCRRHRDHCRKKEAGYWISWIPQQRS